METWKLGRIYTWLGAALAHNTIPNRRFFYDSTDKIFFDFIEIDGQYKLLDGKYYSYEVEELIILKIVRIIENDPAIIEIKKSNRIYPNLFSQSSDSEDCKKKEKEWIELSQEVEMLLKSNSIIIEDTKLLE